MIFRVNSLWFDEKKIVKTSRIFWNKNVNNFSRAFFLICLFSSFCSKKFVKTSGMLWNEMKQIFATLFLKFCVYLKVIKIFWCRVCKKLPFHHFQFQFSFCTFRRDSFCSARAVEFPAKKFIEKKKGVSRMFSRGAITSLLSPKRLFFFIEKWWWKLEYPTPWQFP